MFKRLILISTLFALPAQAGTIVYQNDFESGVTGPEVSGGGNVVGTQGYSSFGFGNLFLQNATGNNLNGGAIQDPTVIQITGLPDHDSVDIGFLLAVINSWDGSAVVPDFFEVRLDGQLLFSETFTNFGIGSVDNRGFTQTADISNRFVNPVNLGFPSRDSFPESAYNYTGFPDFTNIAHSGDALTLSFIATGSGWQGSIDESWGIDNITISVNEITAIAVSEPGTFALFSLGLLGILRRRLFG